MNKSNVYDLLQRIGADVALPDADQLEARRVGSPASAQLDEFQRDLQPLSAQLSTDLGLMFAQTGAHGRTHSARHANHAPRRWRGVAAIAASLIAVVAVWTIQHDSKSVPAAVVVNAAPADRIFASFDEHNVAASQRTSTDEIFHGNFLPDEIFSSSKSNNG